MVIGLLGSMLRPQGRKLAGRPSGYIAACYRGGAAALRRFKCQYGGAVNCTRTRRTRAAVNLIYNTYHTAAPDKNILLAFIFRP